MTSDDVEQRLVDHLRELSRQVRWMRHAIQRLLAVLGLICGGGIAVIVAKAVKPHSEIDEDGVGFLYWVRFADDAKPSGQEEPENEKGPPA